MMPPAGHHKITAHMIAAIHQELITELTIFIGEARSRSCVDASDCKIFQAKL
jgi:hypothetical protein